MRRSRDIPLVAASETGTAQTGVSLSTQQFNLLFCCVLCDTPGL